MTALLARKCLEVLSLLCGVVLLLLLVFESGILGDPALLEVGKHADNHQVAQARMRLGIWEDWDPTALVITGFGFSLDTDNQNLKIKNKAGIGEDIPLPGLNLNDLASLLKKSSGGALKVEIRGDSERPAKGVLNAWEGNVLELSKGLPTTLSWVAKVPAPIRFFRQASALVTFNFGRDKNGQAIGPQLKERGLTSLALALPAFAIATFCALLLSLVGAVFMGRIDKTLMMVSAIGMAVSAIVWIHLLQEWLAGDLGLFPVGGWEAPYVEFLALPVLIWVIVSIWPDLRLYRTVFLEQATASYLLSARAKGLGKMQVVLKHLIPGASVPIVTQILTAIPFLFLGSLLLESVFNIPGLGRWTVDAVESGDQSVLRATVFLSALAWIAAQWIADICCLAIDPRMRVDP
ncbi:MAG TPA: hypothetical protein DDW23_02765 [Planctomycetes bacterium]|nr:hypothetical protein [Planctomycetota bacterium]